jgi:hypothetical protein
MRLLASNRELWHTELIKNAKGKNLNCYSNLFMYLFITTFILTRLGITGQCTITILFALHANKVAFHLQNTVSKSRSIFTSKSRI